MEAHAGDKIVIEGHRQGQPRRSGRIVEVRGHDGHPPYIVRWDDQPHDVLVYPGSDAHIEQFTQQR